MNSVRSLFRVSIRLRSSLRGGSLIPRVKSNLKPSQEQSKTLIDLNNISKKIKCINKLPMRREEMTNLADHISLCGADEVMEILVNQRQLDKVHYVFAVKQLDIISLNFTEENEFERYKVWLWKQPGFYILLEKLAEKCQFYNAESTLQIFTSLKALDFPNDSTLIQAYLKLLTKHVNDLHFDQVVQLFAILTTFHNSPFKESSVLRKLCKRICDCKMLESCDQLDVEELIFLLGIYLDKTVENEDKIVKILSCLSDNKAFLDWENIVDILLLSQKEILRYDTDLAKFCIDYAWFELPESLSQRESEKIIETCKIFPEYLYLSEEKLNIIKNRTFDSKVPTVQESDNT